MSISYSYSSIEAVIWDDVLEFSKCYYLSALLVLFSSLTIIHNSSNCLFAVFDSNECPWALLGSQITEAQQKRNIYTYNSDQIQQRKNIYCYNSDQIDQNRNIFCYNSDQVQHKKNIYCNNSYQIQQK